MGIPRLLGYLVSYASTVRFKSADNHGADAGGAIIDGPALAYHVFRCASDSRRATQTTGGDALSYGEIGEAVLQWLGDLEAHTVHIAAIYFDGALPYHKQDERLLRLENHVKSQQSFKHHPKTKRGLRNLPPSPPPPFMVASVIETLVSGKFRDVVHIVDGEADTYCAALAREKGGIILTSDSDLLLYDLGADGSVVFFGSMQKQLGNATSTPLEAPGYHPATIAKDLRLDSLLALGYEVMRDPFKPLSAVLSAARARTTLASREYESFAEQYNMRTPALTGPTYLHGRLVSDFESSLRVLDPRISEFVVVSRGTSESGADINMYLPPLNDDPDRSNAWNVGRSIRLLAYSLLLSETAHGLVNEFIRRGVRIVADPLQPLAQSAIISAIDALLDAWSTLVMELPGRSATELRRLLGLHLLFTHWLEQEKQVPDMAMSTGLLRGELPRLNWDRIHLSAQLEAAIYSIRILQQCCLVFLGVCVGAVEDSPVIKAVNRLHAFLGGQPSLAELFPAPQSPQMNGTYAIGVRALYKMLNIDVSPPKTQQKKKGKGKGTGLKSKPISLPKSSSSSQASNMYSLLDDGI